MVLFVLRKLRVLQTRMRSHPVEVRRLILSSPEQRSWRAIVLPPASALALALALVLALALALAFAFAFALAALASASTVLR